MKQIFTFLAAVLLTVTTYAQVGIGTINPDTSAALEIESTTKGFLPPRMTLVQINAIATPAEGLMVYCLDCSTKGLFVNNGSDFLNITSGENINPPPPTSKVSDGAGGFYTFLSHNLGADTSLNPHTPVKGLNGDYYQWGKNVPDGDVDNLIGSIWGDQAGSTDTGNWTDNAKGPKDPCPAGFRVPSHGELRAVIDNNTFSKTGDFTNNSPTNFGSALHFGSVADPKLLTFPATGIRSHWDGGALTKRGSEGFSWSSTEGSPGGVINYLHFNTGNPTLHGTNRLHGLPVRCIAE
jgi:hypothetical protein